MVEDCQKIILNRLFFFDYYMIINLMLSLVNCVFVFVFLCTLKYFRPVDAKPYKESTDTAKALVCVVLIVVIL